MCIFSSFHSQRHGSLGHPLVEEALSCVQAECFKFGQDWISRCLKFQIGLGGGGGDGWEEVRLSKVRPPKEGLEFGIFQILGFGLDLARLGLGVVILFSLCINVINENHFKTCLQKPTYEVHLCRN